MITREFKYLLPTTSLAIGCLGAAFLPLGRVGPYLAF
ncbi:hypothetical protein Vi05172_g2981 [Venturia inaequalis]|nr:hypothetical protein Vi05172_g2981 [Venturia inaequalis]